MSDVIINSTHSLDSQERISAVAKSIAELKQRAYANAPTCGRVRLDWVTVAQAAEVFRISKRFLSTWASQGQIQSIKGESVNSHRLVHIDNILTYLQDRLLESPCVYVPSAAPSLSSDSDTSAVAIDRGQLYSNIIAHSDEEDSGSEPASPVIIRSESRKKAIKPVWKFKLKQLHNAKHPVEDLESVAADHDQLPSGKVEQLAALQSTTSASMTEQTTENRMNDS